MRTSAKNARRNVHRGPREPTEPSVSGTYRNLDVANVDIIWYREFLIIGQYPRLERPLIDEKLSKPEAVHDANTDRRAESKLFHVSATEESEVNPVVRYEIDKDVPFGPKKWILHLPRLRAIDSTTHNCFLSLMI